MSTTIGRRMLQLVFEPVQFPSVTFCNLNNIMDSRLHLGGDALTGVVAGIEKAQEEAFTGGMGVEGATERKKRDAMKGSDRAAKRRAKRDAERDAEITAETSSKKHPAEGSTRGKKNIANKVKHET